MQTQMLQDMFVLGAPLLEPGGAISFFARTPSLESLRHDELLARMDQLSAQVAALRS